jgi:hypothetical protein
MDTDSPTPDKDAAKARRDRLLSRAAVIGLILLALAYAIPTFLNGPR